MYPWIRKPPKQRCLEVLERFMRMRGNKPLPAPIYEELASRLAYQYSGNPDNTYRSLVNNGAIEYYIKMYPWGECGITSLTLDDVLHKGTANFCYLYPKKHWLASIDDGVFFYGKKYCRLEMCDNCERVGKPDSYEGVKIRYPRGFQDLHGSTENKLTFKYYKPLCLRCWRKLRSLREGEVQYHLTRIFINNAERELRNGWQDQHIR